MRTKHAGTFKLAPSAEGDCQRCQNENRVLYAGLWNGEATGVLVCGECKRDYEAERRIADHDEADGSLL
jgi:protein-arginine kinase activator protein McsA